MERKYEDAVSTPLAAVAVTHKTIEFIKMHPFMHRGSVCIFTGNVYTDRKFARLRKKALSIKLP